MTRRTAQSQQFQRYKQRIQETYQTPVNPVHCSVDGARWIKVDPGVTQ